MSLMGLVFKQTGAVKSNSCTLLCQHVWEFWGGGPVTCLQEWESFLFAPDFIITGVFVIGICWQVTHNEFLIRTCRRSAINHRLVGVNAPMRRNCHCTSGWGEFQYARVVISHSQPAQDFIEVLCDEKFLRGIRLIWGLRVRWGHKEKLFYARSGLIILF